MPWAFQSHFGRKDLNIEGGDRGGLLLQCLDV